MEPKVVDFNVLAGGDYYSSLKQNCIGLLALLRRKSDLKEEKKNDLVCIATTRILF